jgi:N-sulfoglucosamine sulfohydrolase
MYKSTSILVAGVAMLSSAVATKPNVLVLTVDDMNYDSIGVFGCKVKDTTPNIDRFAKDSVIFSYAHVHASSCIPSRNVVQTGRYLYNSGVEGFYAVPREKVKYKTTADIMRDNGYFTIIRGKAAHSSPYYPYPAWDISYDEILRKKRVNTRHPDSFYKYTKAGIEAAKKAGKPFYYAIDIHDPHTALYNWNHRAGKNKLNGQDRNNPPSKIFTVKDVVIPKFLPDTPLSRKEVAAYYSSVRRADDSFGKIVKALKDAGVYDNTIFVFFSDHGMPFAFAKTALYNNSTRTPLMVRWPGVAKGGTVDNQHVLGTVDILPTLLDILKIKKPSGLDGESFAAILKGQKQQNRDYVYTMYEENVGGNRQPMRSVISKQYGYIVNLWSDGKRKFATATKGMASTREMVRLAKGGDEFMKKRDHLFNYRVKEEFFDYSKDPDSMYNLIDAPAYKKVIEKFRAKMVELMQKSNDPMLAIYKDRNDPVKVGAYLDKLDEEVKVRKADLKYSRHPERKKAKMARKKKRDAERRAKRAKKRKKMLQEQNNE